MFKFSEEKKRTFVFAHVSNVLPRFQDLRTLEISTKREQVDKGSWKLIVSVKDEGPKWLLFIRGCLLGSVSEVKNEQ